MSSSDSVRKASMSISCSVNCATCSPNPADCKTAASVSPYDGKEKNKHYKETNENDVNDEFNEILVSKIQQNMEIAHVKRC